MGSVGMGGTSTIGEFEVAVSPSGRVLALGVALRRALRLPPGPLRLRLGDVVVRADGAPLGPRALAPMAREGYPMPDLRLAGDAKGATYAADAAPMPRGRLRRDGTILRLAPTATTLPGVDIAVAAEQALIAATFDPDGAIQTVNEPLLAAFGYEAADVLGQPHGILVPPDHAQSSAYRAFWRQIREGRPVHAKLLHRTAAAGDLWLLAHYMPMLDPAGHLARVVMLAQDITVERVRAQEARAKVAALDASQGVIEFAPDGTVLAANANVLRAFGYEAADVVGRPHCVLVDPRATDDASHERFWQGLRRGEAASGRFLRLGRDGRRVWLQATYAPIRDARGDVIKVVEFATDVTDRVERDALLESQAQALQRSNAVIQFALDGTILEVNANFLRTMGYERPEELVGRHHAVLVDPDHAASEAYRSFWARLRGGEFHGGEFMRRSRSGSAVWIQATYNPMLDARGEVIRIVKFATDITEARETAARHRCQIAAVEHSQATVEFDTAGHVVAANDAFLSAFGYRRDEVIGRHHAMFCAKGHAASPAYAEHWSRLVGGEAVAGEFERRSRDGATVWVRGVYHPVLDPAGRVTGALASGFDITAEVADRGRIELLSLVTNESDNSVVITDGRGRIEYVNSGFTRLTGYPAEEVMGRKPGSFLQGKQTDRATVERVRDKLARREPFYEEILNYTRGGRPYWISLAINPVLDDAGEVSRFVSIQSNIDATKRQSLEFTRRLEAISATSAVAEWDSSGKPLSRNRYLDEMGCDAIALDAVLDAGERACVVNGETIRREVSWPRAGDRPLMLDAVFNAVCDDEGAVSKVLLFGVDVTERNAVVASAMATIEASTDRIEGMVATIGDIAQQTRTLSLNATVEASKAGDAGRGFAVVAGEVRGLADRATEAASHIAALLRENRAQAKSLGRDAVEVQAWRDAEAGAAASKVPPAARRTSR